PSTEHVVDIPLSWQLLHAATLIIAPPVNPGQLHKHLDNLGQSWQSILSRCSDSIKFAADQLKEIPSSWADRPAEPNQEAIRCPICLEDLYGGQEVKQRDNCCHLFHTACLSRWEHIVPTCPMCRTVNEGLPSSSATTRPLDGEAATNQVITIGSRGDILTRCDQSFPNQSWVN
ncbi:hypothetical protein PSTT_02953, partial [Puccinia striiformis]